MSRTITLQTTLELLTCVSCGVMFAAPEDFFTRRREDHKTFYCPNGHYLSFPDKSDAEKAQAEAEKYKKLWKEQQAYAANVLSERNAAQRSLKATKAAHTRTKNRIANGMCPVCRRTFSPLSEHMHMQHPDYTTEEPTE